MGMLRNPCAGFARFMRVFVSNACSQPREDLHQPEGRCLFPMGLPFPQSETRKGALPASRRRCARFHARHTARRWVNRVVTLFNYFYLGGRAFADAKCIASQPLTELQYQLCNSLVQDHLEWCRSLVLDPASHGRGKGAQLWDLINSLSLVHTNTQTTAVPSAPSQYAPTE